MPLQLVVGPVHPGDGLQQGVVQQLLVEIEGLQDRRVEAGEQHVADHQQLHLAERFVLVFLLFRLRRDQEFVEQFLALGFAQVQRLNVLRVILRRLGDDRHHHLIAQAARATPWCRASRPPCPCTPAWP